MRTKIYSYKGIVGIQSHPDAEGFIAKPEGTNIGCVLNASSIDISKEALELLKKVKKGKKSIGDIDVFEADTNLVVFGWLGSYLNAFRPEDIIASKDYNPELLKASEEEIEIPEEFMNFVDSTIE